MEGPLNQAHLEARKAERQEKAQSWDEAISSHSKAADLLLLAEKRTHDPRMLESLRLQRDAHERQREMVRHRQALQQYVCRYQVNSPSLHTTNLSVATNSVRDDSEDHTDAGDLREPDPADAGDVYSTLAECDSLLHILQTRGRPAGNTSALQAARQVSATKVGKDERQIMEELKVQNGELRLHILSLLHEADTQRGQIFSLHTENQRLRQRLIEGDPNTMVATLTDATANPRDRNQPDTTADLCGDLVDRKPKVTPSEVRVHSEEEEEEGDYFNTDLDFPTLELPPLEIPKYQYQKQ